MSGMSVGLVLGQAPAAGATLVLYVLGGGVVGAFVGCVVFWIIERRRLGSASNEAARIRSDAVSEAERIRKDATVSAKEDLLQRREALEQEIAVQRQEMRDLEKRLSKREDNLERKVDVLGKKERYIENLENSLAVKRTELAEQQADLERLFEEERAALHRISGYSRPEAEARLLEALAQELEAECAKLISDRMTHARETAETQAREVITTAIHRFAAGHTADMVVSSVPLPNEEMKGRIIGREGRNIRAFEKATGMDVIVDDTPGVIVVSGFDGVRREVARRSMERLVQDGRIHPARIEEVVAKTQEEMNQTLVEIGKQTAFDCGVSNLHAREIELLGRLRFRTSYGQNQLQHAVEVAHLAGAMAGELGLDTQLAKRCGLLHDIGKAMDHEVEGGHPEIGADLAKRCGEVREVVESVATHHDDHPANVYAALVSAADAISAARPGARRESLEKYIKRLEQLEEIASGREGVRQAYAIQAGREVRVIVDPDKVGDNVAQKICREIAQEIEAQMTYPGEVQVTLIRESRFVAVAH